MVFISSLYLKILKIGSLSEILLSFSVQNSSEISNNLLITLISFNAILNKFLSISLKDSNSFCFLSVYLTEVNYHPSAKYFMIAKYSE